jgi:anti-anti-sigma factor
MQVKIDTREKFHVITIKERHLAANLTEELGRVLFPFLENEVKNLVLNLEDIEQMDVAAGEELVKIQQAFYEQNASFVVCSLRPAVESALAETGLLELMNVTPTESEAWDIVQMEEIERELLGGDE